MRFQTARPKGEWGIHPIGFRQFLTMWLMYGGIMFVAMSAISLFAGQGLATILRADLLPTVGAGFLFAISMTLIGNLYRLATTPVRAAIVSVLVIAWLVLEFRVFWH